MIATTRRRARRVAHAAASAVRQPPEVSRYLDRHPRDARLHIGCGGALLDGWLNTDRDPPPGAVHLDVTRRFPLPDAAFDHALVEHVVEHVALSDGRRMLAELARVLRPGGRVRVSTPDLTLLAGLVTPGPDPRAQRYAGWAVECFGPGEPGSAGAIALNNAMRAWGHRFLYDERTLAQAMRDAGFTDVRRFGYRESDDPVFAGVEGHGVDPVGIEMRAWETLALEGVRPRLVRPACARRPRRSRARFAPR